MTGDEGSVPVVLDSIFSGEEESPLARCIYFHIEMEETLDPWQLGMRGDAVPFLMVGLAGIIIAPNAADSRFSNVQQFMELVDTIESREGHSVETADIWLPSHVLPQSDLERGTVLRLKRELFLRAMSTREGSGNFFEAFANLNIENAIEISPVETAVIGQWSKIQVSEFGRWENREEPPRGRDLHGMGDFELH